MRRPCTDTRGTGTKAVLFFLFLVGFMYNSSHYIPLMYIRSVTKIIKYVGFECVGILNLFLFSIEKRLKIFNVNLNFL